MKTVYLDQLHWIEISKAIHGGNVRGGTAETLEHMRRRASEGALLFPLSFAHYFETFKRAIPQGASVYRLSCVSYLAATRSPISQQLSNMRSGPL